MAFLNNSSKALHEGKKESKEKPKMEVVVENTSVEKSLKNKFKETFKNEDGSSIMNYICMEVIAPKLKDMIFTGGKAALAMMLFGDPSRDSNDRGGRGTIIDYSTRSRRDSGYSGRSYNRPSKPDITEVGFNSKHDALKVLDALDRRIDEYDCCTVADFYEAVGIEPGHSDYKYGWIDLDKAYISEHRGTFFIEFPKPRYIE